jgi:glycine cleavage system regulatory protein
MVNVEKLETLLSEGKIWLEKLKINKENIHHLRNELYSVAAGKTDIEYLKQVEHFHNLFHIHQINIHDLKHQIKSHITDAERHPNFGHKIPHRNLESQYNFLIQDIEQLSINFHVFVKSQ